MKILHCKEYGPVENLVWEDISSPEPAENEVVVSIKAAALNFPDYLIVQGLISLNQTCLLLREMKEQELLRKLGRMLQGLKKEIESTLWRLMELLRKKHV